MSSYSKPEKKSRPLLAIPHHMETGSMPRHDRPPSIPPTVSALADTTKLVAQSTLTPNLSVGSFLCQPSPPLTTNAQAGVREGSAPSQLNVLASSTSESELFHDSGPLPDKPAITPSKASSTKDMIKYMKVALNILGELVGEPAVGPLIESMDLDERIGMKRRDLEDDCAFLIESVKTMKILLERKGSNIPALLKVSLHRLVSKLAFLSDKVVNNKDDTNIESMIQVISRLLESFLLENHIVGFITMPNLDKANTHDVSQAIRDLQRADAAYDASSDKRRVMCFWWTRVTLLADIAKWIRSLDETRVYLLFGSAGIGKSTIAQTIAARADKFGCLAASFFFSRDETARRNAKSFCTTIAYQLCVYDEEFARAIGTVLLMKQGDAATSKEPLEQLNLLIVEPLRRLVQGRTRPLVIVVDALDECDDEDQPTVLAVLHHLVRELPAFKVVLTTSARRRLGHLNAKVFHLQKIEEKIDDGDVRRYLKHHLSRGQVQEHLKTVMSWSADEEEVENIVRAAGKLFVIASTAVRFVLDKAARDPASQMRKLQTALAQDRAPVNALNGLYTIILRSAVPTGSGRDVVERYQNVIGTMSHVQDPLPMQTLARLTTLSLEAIREVLDRLQSVISLGSNDVPRIYHASFLDYITDSDATYWRDLRVIPRDQHTWIIIRCLDIMNTQLKRNILELGTPAQFLENSAGLKSEGMSDDRIREKISSELQYACMHWANHLAAANTGYARLMKEVSVFAHKHLMHWFETMSWIHKLDLAPRALVMLPRLLKPTYTYIRDIFSDALHFISTFYNIIRRSALHAYHSALPFTPMKNLLCGLHEKDLRYTCQLESREEEWNTTFALQDRDVNRITFSQDGSHLASWSVTEIKLWDATSGTHVKTFMGSNIVLAEDFSVIALLRNANSTLMLYNAVSNSLVARFDSSTTIVRLALSFDGLRVAAALSDGIVSLWDRGTREYIACLDGYSRGLEFSPSGYTLAYFSDHGGIRLWNGFIGESIASLQYESGTHIKFMFSRNGSRLASLAGTGSGQCLTLWNGENGKFIGARDVESWQLAISDDGSSIATGGRTGKVQLWSGNSMSLVDTIEIGEQVDSLALSPDVLAIRSTGNITLYDFEAQVIVASLQLPKSTCLALSPGCDQFAAADSGGTVGLWDIRLSRIVTALAFSQDCTRLTSGHKDGAIRLWATGRTKQIIVTRRLHSQGVTALAFSPNGELFASASEDGTARLWDGRDGVSKGVLERLFYTVPTSIAFSSRLLAVATYYSIVLFDCTSLDFVYAFPQGSNICLSFSSDGSRLASAYNYGSSAYVQIWDVEKHEEMANFNIDSTIERLVLSPYGLRLAITTSRHGNGILRFFDIASGDFFSNPQSAEISWFSPNKVWISQSYDHDQGYCVRGRFDAQDDGVPILWVPRSVEDGGMFTVGSSMFALGCKDGRIVIGQIPPT